MDYTLKSLVDVFNNETYKASKRHNSLYVMILATSLDQDFVKEYLSYYDDLNSFSGDDVLIMGPQFGHPDPRGDGSFENKYDMFKYSFRDRDPHDQEINFRFLEFMQSQTRESYAIAKLLDIRTDHLPVVVFFENLEDAKRFVPWRIRGLDGRRFVIEFRRLLEEVREQCHWAERRQIEDLRKKLNNLSRQRVYNTSDEYGELHGISEKYKEKEIEFRLYKDAYDFYKSLEDLRSKVDEVAANNEIRIPMENILGALDGFDLGEIGDAYDHLIRFYKRWKSRMPQDCRTAFDAFRYPSLSVSGQKMLVTKTATERDYPLLKELMSGLESLFEKEKGKLNELLEEEIDQKAKLLGKSPLTALECILNVPSVPVALSFRQGISGNFSGTVPRVFVSYSHDSAKHMKNVSILAQKLRADMIDCWIDQYEQGPAEGFPRWMQRQIETADIVLIVCTRIYSTRFNGMAEAGEGHGVNFEGHYITQTLYDAGMKNKKFIPVLFPDSSVKDVPVILRSGEYYPLPDTYERLRDKILGRFIEPNQLGDPLDIDWNFS